ncbi:MAG: DNA repair protein RecN [Pseudomonadota bacterium]|nr:MAG: DNA repair protein RecN [Pseudomonadota bacterium]
MLTQLFIRDFAIVKTLELALEPGFTVLTGETGAGKSILIDALALALGERAESHVIRAGCRRAEVTASFALKPNSDAAKWLKAQDLFDDAECLLRRVVEADKGSKGYINGRPVPIQMLRELGELLVDLHGQHEHQSLLKREAQRQILDDYAGLTPTTENLAEQFHALRALEERLATLTRESADRTARVDLLRYQVREFEALKLSAEEIPQIEEEYARLANGAELLQGAQEVVQAAYDDDENSISRQLARAQGKLEGLSRYDAKLAEIATLLNEATIQVDEAAAQLHGYLDGLELDPERLQWLEDRIGTIHDLSRKHKVKPEELPALFEQLRTELGDLEHFDTNVAKLAEDIEKTRAGYFKLAREVSRQRKLAAKKLADKVTARMQELGMPGGRFEVNLTALPDGEMSAYGVERIEFLVSANPGQPPLPLTKVASGGELSRISLALQVETASLGRIPTLIFDEVDVGVGGRVAEIVGQQLRALGKARQALCITHLAQVAALGHQHLAVSKRTKDGAVQTDVQTLTDTARIKEIARMIGGVEISKQTLAHAEDMLSRASA